MLELECARAEERDKAEIRYLNLCSIEYGKEVEYSLGKKAGIEGVIIEMLKEKCSDDFIMQITKVDKTYLDEIKKELKNNKNY